MPSSTRAWSGKALGSGSLLRPGLGGHATLGRGCMWSLPQQPGRPRLRLAHSHPHTLQRLSIGARGSRGNWLGLTQNCNQQLFPWTCRGKWGGGKRCTPSLARLFPWETESSLGCVGEVKVSFLPVTHTSRAFLLPNLDRGPSRPPRPRILECPQELPHARQQDPEPSSPPESE